MPLRIVAAPLAAAAFGLALGVPPCAFARTRAPSTGLATVAYAKPPPDFTFDAGAGPRRLDTLFGRPVVVNFWASWCEPCRAEVGAFAELRRTYGDAVPLVEISEDATPGAAEAFLLAHGVAGAIAVDDPDRRIFSLYSVTPIPVTLVLAPTGVVSHVSVGALDWPELRAAVEAVRPSDLTLPPGFATLGTNVGTPEP